MKIATVVIIGTIMSMTMRTRLSHFLSRDKLSGFSEYVCVDVFALFGFRGRSLNVEASNPVMSDGIRERPDHNAKTTGVSEANENPAA